MVEKRQQWPALQKGDLIVIWDPESKGFGVNQEIGLVLEDTPEDRPPRFLNIGGTDSATALCIGAISVAEREQHVRPILHRKETAIAMKRLAEKLGPLVGRTFPELWEGND